MTTKTYFVDNSPVDVEDKDVGTFLKSYPDAKEAKSFIVEGDTVDVEAKDIDMFQKSYPDAKPTYEEKEPTTEATIGDNYDSRSLYIDKEFKEVKKETRADKNIVEVFKKRITTDPDMEDRGARDAYIKALSGKMKVVSPKDLTDIADRALNAKASLLTADLPTTEKGASNSIQKAIAYHDLGDNEKAIKEYEKAGKSDPNVFSSPEVLKGLAEVYSEIGDDKKAQEVSAAAKLIIQEQSQEPSHQSEEGQTIPSVVAPMVVGAGAGISRIAANLFDWAYSQPKYLAQDYSDAGKAIYDRIVKGEAKKTEREGNSFLYKQAMMTKDLSADAAKSFERIGTDLAGDYSGDARTRLLAAGLDLSKVAVDVAIGAFNMTPAGSKFFAATDALEKQGVPTHKVFLIASEIAKGFGYKDESQIATTTLEFADLILGGMVIHGVASPSGMAKGMAEKINSLTKEKAEAILEHPENQKAAESQGKINELEKDKANISSDLQSELEKKIEEERQKVNLSLKEDAEIKAAEAQVESIELKIAETDKALGGDISESTREILENVKQQEQARLEKLKNNETSNPPLYPSESNPKGVKIVERIEESPESPQVVDEKLVGEKIKSEEEKLALKNSILELSDAEKETASTLIDNAKDPVVLYRGLGGKKNAQGEKLTVHPDVKGTFYYDNRDLANHFSRGEGVETIIADGTRETVSAPPDTPISKLREVETKLINDSKADIVYLETVDARGKETQVIVKNPDVLKSVKPKEEPKLKNVKEEKTEVAAETKSSQDETLLKDEANKTATDNGFEGGAKHLIRSVNKRKKTDYQKVQEIPSEIIEEVRKEREAEKNGKEIEPHKEVKDDVKTVAKELKLSEAETEIYEAVKDIEKGVTESEQIARGDEKIAVIEKRIEEREKAEDKINDRVSDIDNEILDLQQEHDNVMDSEGTAKSKKAEIKKIDKKIKALNDEKTKLESDLKESKEVTSDLADHWNDMKDGEFNDVQNIVDRVNIRLETRKGVKAGTDLFPEDANIPEFKAIKKELKEKTDEGTIAKFEQRTAEQVEKSEPIIESIERETENIAGVETKKLEELDRQADELLKDEHLREDIEAATPKKLTVKETSLKDIARSKIIKGAKEPTYPRTPPKDTGKKLKESLFEAVKNPSKETYNKFVESFEAAFENPYKGTVATKEAFRQLHETFPELTKAIEEGNAKKAADIVRKGKLGNDMAMVGIPFFKQIWNGAIEVVAKAIESGEKLKTAVQKGINYINKSKLSSTPPTKPQGYELSNLRKSNKLTELTLKKKRGGFFDRVYKGYIRHLEDISGNAKESLKKEGAMETVMMKDIANKSSGKASLQIEKQDKEIFDGLKKDELQDLGNIIQAKRIIQLDEIYDKRGQPRLKHKLGYTKEFYEKALEEMKRENPERYKKLEEKADKYFDAQNELLDLKKENGLLTQEAYDYLKEQSNYSPRVYLQHIDDIGSSINRGKKISVGDGGIKALGEGSEGLILEDARLLLGMSTSKAYNIMAKNDAAKSLLNFAKENPDNAVVMERNVVGVTKDGKPIYEDVPAGKDVISAMVDGQRKDMIVSTDFANDWVASDPAISAALAESVQWLTGSTLLRYTATGANPLFALANAPRDMAYIYFTTGTYSKHLPKFAVEIHKDMATVVSDVVNRKGRYKEFIEEGGSIELLTHQGRIYQGKAYGQGINKISKVLGYVGETSELLTRIAMRERGIKNGVEKFEKTNNRKPNDKELKDIKVKATYDAINQLDFSQGGDWSKALNKFIPYFNAALQANRGLFRAARNNPKEFSYKAAQLGTLAGALVMYNMNQDGWEDVDTKERAKNYIMMLPFYRMDDKGRKRYKYIKIAKTQDAQFISAVAEQAVEYAFKDKEPDRQMLEALKNQAPPIPFITNPPPTSEAVMTYYSNYDRYFDKKLWKGDPEAPNEEQFYKNTPEAYKIISHVTGASPERLRGAMRKVTPSVEQNPYITIPTKVFSSAMEAMGAKERDELNKTFVQHMESSLGGLYKKYVGETFPKEDRKELSKLKDEYLKLVAPETYDKYIQGKEQKKIEEAKSYDDRKKAEGVAIDYLTKEIERLKKKKGIK